MELVTVKIVGVNSEEKSQETIILSLGIILEPERILHYYFLAAPTIIIGLM